MLTDGASFWTTSNEGDAGGARQPQGQGRQLLKVEPPVWQVQGEGQSEFTSHRWLHMLETQ